MTPRCGSSLKWAQSRSWREALESLRLSPGSGAGRLLEPVQAFPMQTWRITFRFPRTVAWLHGGAEHATHHHSTASVGLALRLEQTAMFAFWYRSTVYLPRRSSAAALAYTASGLFSARSRRCDRRFRGFSEPGRHKPAARWSRSICNALTSGVHHRSAGPSSRAGCSMSALGPVGIFRHGRWNSRYSTT